MRPSFTGTYRPGGRVDVHLPDLPGPHPVVVVVSGGLLRGSRREPTVRHLAAFLVDAGWAVVAFDRRASPFRGSFEAAVDDARAVLRWVGASDLDLDPDRTAVVGIGTGAAVAAVAADAPLCLAGFYGPYDFTRLGRIGGWLLADETDPARLAWRSPAHVCRTPAPVLLLHGTHDRIVPVAHAERLVESRRARGLPVRLRLVQGAGHGFLDQTGSAVWDDVAGELLGFLLEGRTSDIPIQDR